MPSVDRDLIPDETLVYKTNLHWIVLVVPFALAAILGLAGLLLLARPKFLTDPFGDLADIRQSLFGGPPGYLVVLGAVFIIVAVVVAIGGLWHRSSTELSVTNRRVMVKTGIVLRHTMEILLSKVESIEVDQTIMGRMLGFGSVVVRGTGGTPEPIQLIDNPQEFRKQVQEQIGLRS
jgi:membrane protein YdbS with pleckstrin-like domain